MVFLIRVASLLASSTVIACGPDRCEPSPLEDWCSPNPTTCEPLPETIVRPEASDHLYYECGGMLVLREYDTKDGGQRDKFYDPATADPVAGTLGELVGLMNEYEVYKRCRVTIYGDLPAECLDYDGPYLCGSLQYVHLPQVSVHPCPP